MTEAQSRQPIRRALVSVYDKSGLGQLAKALIDAKVGETREYTIPSGAVVKVTLVSAEPYHS